MPKFFVDRSKITDDKIIIDTGDAAHISRVLRLGKGDIITVCDGRGIDYNARICEADDKKTVCEIISQSKNNTEPEIEVTLFQGLPKASKMEYIIQKTVELGISRIVPCALSRCVVKLDGKKAEEKKTLRWRKIAEAAAKQSGRGIIPEITMPVTLDEAVSQLKKCDICFAPYECEENTRLKDILTAQKAPKKVGFIIGPEGGFDKSEIEKLKNAGIPTVTLGRRILRTETAGEAVLAMIMYEIGDIN